MVLRDTRGHEVISEKDIRKCRLYLDYLLQEQVQLPPINRDDPAEINRTINHVLDNQLFNHRRAWISGMKLYCSKQFIPISDFDWIEKNDRACYWLWVIVREAIFHQLNGNNDRSSPYRHFNLNPTPSNTSERYKCIVLFFDCWIANPPAKTSYLEIKKNEWSRIFNAPKPFKWLKNDDEQQCQWTWSHLSKEQISCFIHATNTEERYHAIFAAFDTWTVNDDHKKLFLIRINRAWSQKKYRDNLEGKKPLNTYLTIETKNKLDKLSHKNRRKMHEMLEDIIIDAYDRDKNSN